MQSIYRTHFHAHWWGLCTVLKTLLHWPFYKTCVEVAGTWNDNVVITTGVQGEFLLCWWYWIIHFMKVEDWKTKNVSRQAISVARLYQIVNRFKASPNKTQYLQHILVLLFDKNDFRWIFSTFLIWPFIHSFAHDAFSFSLDKHPPLSYRRSPVSSWSNWAKRTLVFLQLSKISQP